MPHAKPRRRALSSPNPDAYVVPRTGVAAGAYPGLPSSRPSQELDDKLNAFFDSGISAFIDLTDPADGLEPYAPRARELGAERGTDIAYDRLTIRDVDTCTPAHMRTVLDLIDTRLAEGRGVYVHCWGGIGRTGMAIGCWLVRHGRTGTTALEKVDELFRTMAPDRVARHRHTGSPQTQAQREMVLEWVAEERRTRDANTRGGEA